MQRAFRARLPGRAALQPGSAAVAGEPFVSAEGLGRTFDTANGSVTALGPMPLRIDRGETLSVVGPSGCGKSTLLRLVAGLDRPSTGSVRIHGTPVDGPVPDVGIVFQDDLLLDWRSVLDNVLLPADIRGVRRREMRQRAHDLLGQLDIDGFADSRPHELSGGMRQRVSIARALLLRPSILLMDEPFSSLDALTRDQMNVLLQDVQQAEGTTTLFITHSIPEAIFLADRIVVMSQRPGTVLDEFRVELPRPRRLGIRETSEFTELVKRVRLDFEGAGVLRA